MLCLLGALLLGWSCGPGEPPEAASRPAAPTAEEAPDGFRPGPGPRLVVLGTVQDGGLPHAACHGPHCQAARADPARRRRVASLGIVVPKSSPSGTDWLFLIDATPDLVEQLHALSRHRRSRAPSSGPVDRSPLDGVFLTHAHMGHYLGLAHFGFEAVHTRGLAIWGTARMLDFLASNGPWEQLVSKRNLELRELPVSEPGVPETGSGAWVELGEGIAVAAFPWPPRDEYTATVGYLIRGPKRTALYVPDTDGWDAWTRPLTEVLGDGVDLALLDGTFFSMDELPGRDITQVRHPLMRQTMDLLEPLVKRGGLEVAFTHLNHTNPALEPEGPERRELWTRGFRVLKEGEELGL